jgi:plastocyanin
VSAKLRTVLAALLLGLAVGGCAHPVSAGVGGTVRVALNEYRLNPASIRARAGSLTVVATNLGRLAHNLVVSRGGVTQATMKPIGPGQSGQLTVTLVPGTYLIGSTLLSDEALGLYGHVTVTR